MPSDRTETTQSVRLIAFLSNSRKAILEWLAWTAIAGVAFLQIGNFRREIADYAFGADGWPLAICSAIFIGATLQLVVMLLRNRAGMQSQLESAGNSRETDSTPGWPSLQLVAIFMLPFIYLFLMPRLGFFAMTPFFIVALLLLMQVRSFATIALVTLFAYGIALLIFTRLFYVALPVGRIEPFYGINNAIVSLVRAGM
ncbi:MAG: tripartite tricarboxylate transporter TctB family protein [Rhodobacteraceae bacterium]|nr:tripartite tricarboxylate transporter TctB family protein [Paracoccaceae bacterium]